jgi:hypothetical protein
MEIITLDNSQEWDKTIHSMHNYDIYHTAAYHTLETSGTPLLLYSQSGNQSIAMPVVLRDIAGTTLRDITSVYGYAGPLSSNKNPTKKHINQFQTQLLDFFDTQSIISAFARLHPLFPFQSNILDKLGAQATNGATICIDLRQPEKDQWHQYSHSLRNHLNRIHKTGQITIKQYTSEEDINAFITIYHQTMHRVNAAGKYFFDTPYFHHFLNTIPSDLFLALYGNKPIAGTIFTKCNKIIQTHLSGTLTEYLPLSPLKYIRDEIRRYGINHGFHYMHTGGGFGGQRDTVYEFKSQFSKNELIFKTWRYIHQPEIYADITKTKQPPTTPTPDYFPAYRAIE